MTEQWFEGSAPGRLDVMGGIADYSGSLVLQMPIRETTVVRLRLRNDYYCDLSSEIGDEKLQASFGIRELIRNVHKGYDVAQAFFRNNTDTSWAAYVIGCALVVCKEKAIDFRGADFEIQSEVPLGKGVSSSASIEVATMKALQKAFQIDFKDTELARLAQRAENLVVGAPCGLMDQLASYFGKEALLLPIICQPDKLLKPIAIPADLHFLGIDSGVRHSVGGASYTDVRCAAFMGYSIIASHFGVSANDILHARATGDRLNLPYNGYLANIAVAEFELKYKSLLPREITGEEFKARYKETIDPVTVVEPGKIYNILSCTQHPVYEHDRVNRFMNELSQWDHKASFDQAKKLGELMVQSHESYSECGLGSQRTDELVALLSKCSSISGAKITGGGSGGTVCALAIGEEGLAEASQVHKSFENEHRTKLAFFK